MEEIEQQRKDLEAVTSPIMTRLYQGGAPPEAAAAGADAAAAGPGPKIEEVD